MNTKLTKLLSTLSGVAALLCMGGVILAVAAWTFLPAALAEQLARRMIPPVYPGAQLIRSETISDLESTTEVSVYSAPVHITGVQTWMERAMPGFITCTTTATPINPRCNANVRCDDSSLSRWSAQLVLGTGDFRVQPCVFVVVQSEATDDRVTLIQVSVSWPSNGTDWTDVSP